MKSDKLNFFERIIAYFCYERMEVDPGEPGEVIVITYYKIVNGKRHVTRERIWNGEKFVEWDRMELLGGRQ